MQAVEGNRLAVGLDSELYQNGLTSFLDVIQTQQTLYEA
jgi:outer membrane protein TolC